MHTEASKKTRNKLRGFYGTMKLNGRYQQMNISGQWYSHTLLDNPTLYTSPYLVVTPRGYTKHYYAGEERVVSRLGEGIPVPTGAHINGSQSKIENQIERMRFIHNECLSQTTNDAGLEILQRQFVYLLFSAPPSVQETYYYHPDHLGSSSWITDQNGDPIQFLHYLPFGETAIDQRATRWNAPYTFSGKEKDEETGYSYFGARYYNSDLSIWLSVDPMADKYPHQSNYVYCSNNPLRIIDPDGMDEYEFDTKGKLMNVIENENADILRVVKTDRNGNVKTDRDGNKKVKATSREFEAGSIADGGNVKLGPDQFDATVLTMSEKGEGSRVEMFEFLAENTDSEWGTYAGTRSWGDYDGRIATSREEGRERATSFFVADIIRGEGKVSEWYHSDPTGGMPSGYDHTSSSYRRGDHGVAIHYGSRIPNMRSYNPKTGTYHQFGVGGYDEIRKK